MELFRGDKHLYDVDLATVYCIGIGGKLMFRNLPFGRPDLDLTLCLKRVVKKCSDKMWGKWSLLPVGAEVQGKLKEKIGTANIYMLRDNVHNRIDFDPDTDDIQNKGIWNFGVNGNGDLWEFKEKYEKK